VAIFTLIFGRHIGTTNMPGYPPFSLFIFAAMIPWLFIAQAISAGGMSLVNQQNLLSKIYMPRLFIPAATIGSALVDACISFGVFMCWMAVMKYVPSWHIVFLPFLILLTILMAMGLAFLLSALTVTYRDLRFLIPFITQIGMWVSAVVWPVHQIVPAEKQWILMFNPLFGLFDAYRSCIFGLPLRQGHLISAIVATLAILTLGLFYFRKTERRFADIA
jgi:lipopolysaccharide transport system permease protein